MPKHSFRLEWTVRNYVLSHNGKVGLTTCGGELKVTAESETQAAEDFRKLPEMRFANIRVTG